MSAYTDYLAGLLPYNHYTLTETGTTYVDSGRYGVSNPGLLNLTRVTGPTQGVLPIVPGDPTGFAVEQTTATDQPFAERTHNSLLDQPNAPGKSLTLNIWAKPYQLESGSTQIMFSKPNTYQFMFVGDGVRFDIGNTGGGQWSTNLRDLVIPNRVAMWTAVWDGNGNTQSIYRNATLVATRSWDETTTMPWTASNNLQIGGQNLIGNSGFTGALQHASIFVDNNPTQAQLRTLYEKGIVSIAELFGVAANVFPWDRVVVASLPGVRRRRIVNDSDTKIFLGLGVPSNGGGALLYPGDVWESPRIVGSPVFTGDIYASHGSTYGVKRLAITQE